MILTIAMLATLYVEPGRYNHPISDPASMTDEQAAKVASNAFVFMQERNPTQFSKKFERKSAIEILLEEPKYVSDCDGC